MAAHVKVAEEGLEPRIAHLYALNPPKQYVGFLWETVLWSSDNQVGFTSKILLLKGKKPIPSGGDSAFQKLWGLPSLKTAAG